jgi:hypothetical protein
MHCLVLLVCISMNKWMTNRILFWEVNLVGVSCTTPSLGLRYYRYVTVPPYCWSSIYNSGMVIWPKGFPPQHPPKFARRLDDKASQARVSLRKSGGQGLRLMNPRKRCCHSACVTGSNSPCVMNALVAVNHSSHLSFYSPSQ